MGIGVVFKFGVILQYNLLERKEYIMSGEGLCRGCKEELKEQEKKSSNILFTHSWVHCHHEPKEELPCWCSRVRNIVYTIIDGETLRVGFCPQCGRKL